LQVLQRSTFGKDSLEQPEEYGHTRAAESIDGLLRIPDDHEPLLSKTARAISILGKQRDDFRLHFIGVLKFIYE
jgi:hypothetical protein